MIVMYNHSGDSITLTAHPIYDITDQEKPIDFTEFNMLFYFEVRSLNFKDIS